MSFSSRRRSNNLPDKYRPQLPLSTIILIGLFLFLLLLFMSLILMRANSKESFSERGKSLVSYFERIITGEDSASQTTPGSPEGLPEAGKGVPVAIIAGTNVYADPANKNEILSFIEAGETATAIAISDDNRWVQISQPDAEAGAGWIPTSAVSFPDELSLPTISVAEQNLITPTPTVVYKVTAFVNVNIRSGPGLEYEKIETLEQGESIEVIGIDPQGFWWAVKLPLTGEIGWVSVDYVVGADKEEVPVLDPNTVNQSIIIPTPQPGSPMLTATAVINVRSGPGIEFTVIIQLKAGQKAEIVGISQDRQWWAIKLTGQGQEIGWVSVIYVEASNAEDVPIIGE